MGFMNDETIVLMYQKAADKEKQIRDLAKLNKCSCKLITQILVNHGIPAVKVNCGRKPQKKAEEPTKKEIFIPDFIKIVLSNKLDDLDRAITEKEKELSELKSQYSTLSKFIKGEIL